MKPAKQNPAGPRQAPRVLIAEDDLDRRIAELAAEIDRDYADSDRLVAIGVLKGSVFFLVDLLKRLTIPVAVDFFQTSSYGDSTEPMEHLTLAMFRAIEHRRSLIRATNRLRSGLPGTIAAPCLRCA